MVNQLDERVKGQGKQVLGDAGVRWGGGWGLLAQRETAWSLRTRVDRDEDVRGPIVARGHMEHVDELVVDALLAVVDGHQRSPKSLLLSDTVEKLQSERRLQDDVDEKEYRKGQRHAPVAENSLTTPAAAL